GSRYCGLRINTGPIRDGLALMDCPVSFGPTLALFRALPEDTSRRLVVTRLSFSIFTASRPSVWPKPKQPVNVQEITILKGTIAVQHAPAERTSYTIKFSSLG